MYNSLDMDARFWILLLRSRRREKFPLLLCGKVLRKNLPNFFLKIDITESMRLY